MQDKWNIDALLSEAAKQDNCALPFTQWKAELLSAAEEDNEWIREAYAQKAPPTMDELGERRVKTLQRLKTFRKNITWGFATAAAVLIVVLAASSSRLGMGGGASAPAPRAMPQDAQRTELTGESMPSAAAEPEAGAAGAADGKEESIQVEIFSADEPVADQNTMAGIDTISLPPEDNAEMAIEAVEAALIREALATTGAPAPARSTAATAPTPEEGPGNDRDAGDDSGSAPIATATFVSGQTYRIRTLSGEEATVTPETAYVVGYEGNTILYLVDAESMEVLGVIFE